MAAASSTAAQAKFASKAQPWKGGKGSTWSPGLRDPSMVVLLGALLSWKKGSHGDNDGVFQCLVVPMMVAAGGLCLVGKMFSW